MYYPTPSPKFLIALLCLAIASLSAQGQQKVPIPTITYEDVSYGDHPNQVVDFWRADVDGTAPLVIFIHGGGFQGGRTRKSPLRKSSSIWTRAYTTPRWSIGY